MKNKRRSSAAWNSQRPIEDGQTATSFRKDTTTRARGKQELRATTGRIVGEVRNGVFHKKVRESRHLLRTPRGWASDVCVLDQLEALDVQWIQLDDAETHKVYRAKVDDFWLHGEPLDRGHGPQLVLPLKFWKTTQPGQPQFVQLSFSEVRP